MFGTGTISRRRGHVTAAVSGAILCLIVATCVCLVSAVPALATVTGRLLLSSPAAGSRLSSAPTQIRLQFNLLLTFDTWVRVTGPRGVVTSRHPHILAGLAVQALPDGLPDGPYTVDYNADFGLFGSTRGTVPFSVGPAPPATASSGPVRPVRSDRSDPVPVPIRDPAQAPATPDPPGASDAPTSGPPSSPARAPTAVAGTTPGDPGSTSSPATAVPGAGPGGGTHPGQAGVRIRKSTDGESGSWPRPPSPVLAGLFVAVLLFAADRRRTSRRDGAQARRPAARPPR